MNVPTAIPARTVDSAAQSLMTVCRNRRWDLLQQFARLEIALKQKLEAPPKMFGSKVRAWIELDPTAKRFERLIDARNLVAHAAVDVVQFNSNTFALWVVADGTSELNCTWFDKAGFKTWVGELERLLEQAADAAANIDNIDDSATRWVAPLLNRQQ